MGSRLSATPATARPRRPATRPAATRPHRFPVRPALGSRRLRRAKAVFVSGESPARCRIRCNIVRPMRETAPGILGPRRSGSGLPIFRARRVRPLQPRWLDTAVLPTGGTGTPPGRRRLRADALASLVCLVPGRHRTAVRRSRGAQVELDSPEARLVLRASRPHAGGDSATSAAEPGCDRRIRRPGRHDSSLSGSAYRLKLRWSHRGERRRPAPGR
jgi:hypothetical protein